LEESRPYGFTAVMLITPVASSASIATLIVCRDRPTYFEPARKSALFVPLVQGAPLGTERGGAPWGAPSSFAAPWARGPAPDGRARST
jgi:hypothetical protein